MQILSAESTPLFVGTEAQPRQVVRVGVRGTEDDQVGASFRASVRGEGLDTPEPVEAEAPGAGVLATLEVGVLPVGAADPGTALAGEVVVEQGDRRVTHPVVVTVAEPGWRMFMISHFHYDPVWWNTQAAYTETWGASSMFRNLFQEPGLALVKAHMEMARIDPDYKFVLAELDYLKPYWDVYPEDRAYLRVLMHEGRLELMGGTYNEPNTNLTSAETTIRNAIYGVGYQRDVLGGDPRTAWQLDAFGHDPQFPGIMADAGISSSSWARGPFHEWGPHWVRGPGAPVPVMTHVGEAPRMQFHSEFDWVSPGGGRLLTSFMPDHYSAGWWMDSATTLEQAEAEVFRIFLELQAEATTRNVLLPVGTDYSPPNKWVTLIHRDWNSRYVWPRFQTAIARDFFDAVQAERSDRGRPFSPQTRDMNPVYTGKDVSFIDTKQAQRAAENTLLAAERFGTVASLLGARYPSEAFDKAWRHLLFGAHHDGITGSESDQVYLDLLGGWREATELARTALDGALGHIGGRIDTSGDGRALAVFNPLSWERTDVTSVELRFDDAGTNGIELRDAHGERVPWALDGLERHDDGSLSWLRITFIAADVPALGYRTYRVVPAGGLPDDSAWRTEDGAHAENEAYAVEVDAARGGAIVSLLDKRTGKQILREGETGNELRCYREYPMHPHFGEGPWHLTPDGTYWSSLDAAADVSLEVSPIGQRISVRAPFHQSRRTQVISLWQGVERVDLATSIDEYSGQDRLFRVRFGAAVEGGMPVSEVGDAVVGRGFGFPDVDVALGRFTLDDPAYDWFALGSTARVELVGGAEGGEHTVRAARAFSVAEIIVPGETAQDEAVEELVVGLVRRGVTATLGRHDRSRYGTLDIDSNLPDVRIVVGGAAENRYTAGVLRAADPGYGAEMERQLAERGSARIWVPAERPLAEIWDPTADVRGFRQLPVLIVTGKDADATVAAIRALTDDLADSAITVEQPPDLDGTTGRVEDYSVALINRGIPSFNVSTDGAMHLSVMRSCSGWPSGVWIDPPRRTVPDGSNFQFQHWSHTFEYSLTGGPGDWRDARFVRHGHEFNEPLLARVLEPHDGDLPPTSALLQVDPPTAVLSVLKPVGDPLASMADPRMDPAKGVELRIYESNGDPTSANVRFFTPLHEAVVTDLRGNQLRTLQSDGSITVDLDPAQILTLRAVPEPFGATQDREPSDGPAELAPRSEVAQPVFVDYWLHNKGPAPMGYQPVAVQIRPHHLSGAGPFGVPVAVSSERTDAPVTGLLRFEAPSGWEVQPSQRAFRIAPGGFLEMDLTVIPAEGATPGRYFVAARIEDAGRVEEDVVTIDLRPDDDPQTDAIEARERSPLLARSVEEAMRVPKVLGRVSTDDEAELGNELDVALSSLEIHVRAGERGRLEVRLRNDAASEIRGEAQVISPHETWPLLTPWTQGFSVEAGAEQALTFEVAPPPGHRSAEYWALVKVMYFGRLHYTEAARIVLEP